MSNNKQNLSSAARKGLWPAVTGLTALLAVAAAVLGMHSFKAEATAPAAAQQGTPVSVATVASSEINAWDEFSGRLEAVQRVDVRSRVAGAVQAVHFREGALVKQGDLLITIDPAPYAAEVERAEAQVASAQARQAFSRSEQERAKRLWDQQAIAQREYDERVNAAREAEANLRAAQASLQSARLNLGYTQVRAPVAGRIGKLEVTMGNLVAAGPGAPVLTTLVSVSPIYASFDADEQVITRALKDLPSGASARGQIESIPVQMGTAGLEGTPFTGKLQLIDNQVDARSGTVRAGLLRQQGWRPHSGPVRPHPHGPGAQRLGTAGERARHRHRPEQEVRDGGGRGQQGHVPRSDARRIGQRAARGEQGPEGRRPRGGQRPAAHPPRCAGGAAERDDGRQG